MPARARIHARQINVAQLFLARNFDGPAVSDTASQRIAEHRCLSIGPNDETTAYAAARGDIDYNAIVD